MDLNFVDGFHKSFYYRVAKELMDDDKGKLMAYTLGASPMTREHFDEIYDGAIRSSCWRESWNTSDSRLLIAWAMAMVGEIEAPAAAGGTLVPCLLAAYQWSDALETE